MKNYSAIKEMFYGNRGNCESIKVSKEEKDVLAKVSENEEEFLSLIKKDIKLVETYNKLNAQIGEMGALNSATAYEEGFRFGFLMAMDILNT